MQNQLSHSKIKGFSSVVLLAMMSILSLLGSCNFSGRFVSDEKMEKIMADAMIMEAGNQVFYNFGILPDSVWERDYGFICKKYDVNYPDFVEQMKYFQHEPEDFSVLMEKVITRLQKMDSRYDLRNYRPKNLPSSLRDKALREQGVQEMKKVQILKLAPVKPPAKLNAEAQKKQK